MPTKMIAIRTLIFFATFLFICGAAFADDKVQTGIAAINDIRMYYEIRGKGEPLILLHGGLASTASWEKQFSAFSKDYKVIAIDSRGHGRSTFSDKQITYSLMASDVIAFMDFLKIKKVNIVGWSDGGIIGLILAIHHPDRIGKLVAYGANFDPSGLKPDLETNPKFKAYLESAVTNYQKLSPDPKRMDAFMENITKMWASEPHLSEKDLGSIRVPTLILDGESDEGILTEHTRKLAGFIPNAKLVLIPGTGHFAPLEKPEMFNREVLSFLAK